MYTPRGNKSELIIHSFISAQSISPNSLHECQFRMPTLLYKKCFERVGVYNFLLKSKSFANPVFDCDSEESEGSTILEAEGLPGWSEDGKPETAETTTPDSWERKGAEW